MKSAVITVLVALLALSCSPQSRPLEIATTSSVVNSGLLDFILRNFEDPVRVHAAGSGRALAMLSDQVVGLVISHAPESEARSLAEHPDWDYQKIAYNQFIVLGPRSDPADVRGAVDAADAFKRIAVHGALFVSRGDQSGTHEREMALWRQSDIDPTKERVLIGGGSMATTLRQANELAAYTLSDEATWWQLQPSLTLEELLTNDVALLNTYAVIHPRRSSRATAFARWLAEGKGRESIAAFRGAGKQPFNLWPQNCARDKPAALPCN